MGRKIDAEMGPGRWLPVGLWRREWAPRFLMFRFAARAGHPRHFMSPLLFTVWGWNVIEKPAPHQAAKRQLDRSMKFNRMDLFRRVQGRKLVGDQRAHFGRARRS
jgi:hypothetical protein